MGNRYKFYRLHPKIEVRNARQGGEGLFATGNIGAGERLLVLGGYVLTVEEEALLDGKLGDNGVQIAEDLVLCATMPDEWGWVNYLNHSCEPNSGFQGQIVLVAMRDILSNEQITIDYAMVLHRSTQGLAYRLTCLCGSDECRGVITDEDWKIERLQTKYDGYFQPYLQEKIKSRFTDRISR